MREDILCRVERPSRYIGNEFNLPHKSWRTCQLRFALAFPDVYEVGMSHLGLLLLYHILNQQEWIGAERVFAPWPDMEKQLRARGQRLTTLESQAPLADFDIVGFSLQYELSYTNVLNMLELGGIPLHAAARSPEHPLVVGGGPCCVNPEPLAPFFDLFVLGEAEELVVEIAAVVARWRRRRGDKLELLAELSGLEGVYVPSLYHPEYDQTGRLRRIRPQAPAPPRVRRHILPELEGNFPSQPLVPNCRIVHDRLGIEIARGCTRGCRFCQAGYIYRPVRERRPQEILTLLDRGLAATGFDEFSFLALSAGDYSNIVPLVQQALAAHLSQRVGLSLPSLRVGTLDPTVVAAIRQVRKTGFTLAPEAGSQRLRRVINKDISDDELLATVDEVYQAGWTLIKLYFMTGLPTETDEDLEALVDLCLRVWQQAASHGPRRRLHVSISTFVPKPHTPFQWAPQLPIDEIHRRLHFFRRKLRRPGLQLKWTQPYQSMLEAVFSRGDRRLAPLLLRAFKAGCRFDGWSELLQVDTWHRCFRESGLDPSSYAEATPGLDEPLPWDHLDVRVNPDYLRREYLQAMAAEFTPDCRRTTCLNCGVCDQRRIKLRLQPPTTLSAPPAVASSVPPVENHLYRLVFTKRGYSRFLSHLELINVFHRAMRRARLPLAFSAGYHPKAKISLSEALPVGIESNCEELTFALTRLLLPEEIQERLNASLPPTIQVRRVEQQDRPPSELWRRRKLITYEAWLPPGEGWNETGFHRFAAGDLGYYRQKSKRGERQIDIRHHLLALDDLGNGRLRLRLRQEQPVRIRELLRHLFELTDEQLRRLRIVKLAVEFDGEDRSEH